MAAAICEACHEVPEHSETVRGSDGATWCSACVDAGELDANEGA